MYLKYMQIVNYKNVQNKKGWMATIMSGFLDATVGIPDYIINAIAFASSEVMNTQIEKKMLLTVLERYKESRELLQRLQACREECDFIDIKTEFVKDYSEDNLAKFFLYQDRISEKYRLLYVLISRAKKNIFLISENGSLLIKSQV